MIVASMLNKPLTKKMIENLMDCHERELLNLEPHDVSTLHNPQGLIERGMLDPVDYITKAGKKVLAFYVTSAGRRYLRNL